MVNKQDYLNAINQNIEIVRGDTLAFNFILGGLGSLSAYNALAVNLSVAEHYNEPVLVQLSKGNGIAIENYDASQDQCLFSVNMAPAKTSGLEIGRYYYDIQISNSSNVITLMRGILTLLYDITR